MKYWRHNLDICLPQPNSGTPGSWALGRWTFGDAGVAGLEVAMDMEERYKDERVNRQPCRRRGGAENYRAEIARVSTPRMSFKVCNISPSECCNSWDT